MPTLFILFLYFIPSLIAFYRHKKNRRLILILNLFLGVTIVGWIVSLIWANSDDKNEEFNFSPNFLYDSSEVETLSNIVEKSPYQIRFRVMNNSEEAFFHELQKQLPRDFYVFPKVRIADILKTIDGQKYYVSRNKILPRHVDFLICDLQFKPRMAIEINGGSHHSAKVIESDALKKKIFGELNFPLRVVNVGETFASVVQEIVSTLTPGSENKK
jgi:hypothetical protein